MDSLPHRTDRVAGRTACAAVWSLLCVALLCAGCGGSSGDSAPRFAELTGLAGADSLDLATFFTLTPAERSSRRAAAAVRMRAADAATVSRGRAESLLAAAGLAPDDPDPWLQLAEMWRWAGDYLHAEACLDHAAAAVKAWGSPAADGPMDRSGRDDAARRTALLRAWLHYDRAEWRRGMEWAQVAANLKSGDRDVWRIQGLLAAAMGQRSQAHEFAADIRRKDTFSSDVNWILAVLDCSRGQDRAAFALLLNSDARGNTVAELRPNREHAAECYRDMGTIAERVGEWAYARRWFAESRAAVPLGRTDRINEVKVPRLGPAGQAPVMPVWLAFDRHFVTGSLSAYANLALARFQAAGPGEDQDFWAAATVNATGIILRREEDRAWALRARGLVFAGRNQPDRGLADLRKAADLLAAQGLSDAGIEGGIGHLLLIRQDPGAARHHLQKAVALDPALATAWSDLGLVAVMAADPAEATAAFARALDLDPGLVAAWYNRGLMHLHAGDLDAAAADLGEAARLAPGNQDVARLLQQLETQRRQAP